MRHMRRGRGQIGATITSTAGQSVSHNMRTLKVGEMSRAW
jgi:hypothetical protein